MRSAYRRHISLRGHGAVTSLLLELQRSSPQLQSPRGDKQRSARPLEPRSSPPLEPQRNASHRARERPVLTPGASAAIARSPGASGPQADAAGSRRARGSGSVDDSDSDEWDTDFNSGGTSYMARQRRGSSLVAEASVTRGEMVG